MIQVIKYKMINFVKIYKWNKVSLWKKVIIRMLVGEEGPGKGC